MAAQFDNSTEQNLYDLSSRTGEGVVIDIGTGDGRFVSAQARTNPNKFYIGIDANVKPLEKPSMRATRKPSKGGLTNALFVQAAVEDLPEELNSVADEIHIHFPWGRLLRAVALGDPDILASLRRIAAPDCLLEIVVGIDLERDESEIKRLELPAFTDSYIRNKLIPRYERAGFSLIEFGRMAHSDWSRIETSWAKRLQGSTGRNVIFLAFGKELK